MPSLPGGESLELKPAAKAKRAKKGKGKGDPPPEDSPPREDPPRKRKGDEELFQLDLRRKRIQVSQNTDSKLRIVINFLL